MLRRRKIQWFWKQKIPYDPLGGVLSCPAVACDAAALGWPRGPDHRDAALHPHVLEPWAHQHELGCMRIFRRGAGSHFPANEDRLFYSSAIYVYMGKMFHLAHMVFICLHIWGDFGMGRKRLPLCPLWNQVDSHDGHSVSARVTWFGHIFLPSRT